MRQPNEKLSEDELITARREIVGGAQVGDAVRWGLGLSGGGIRSATFSLGVLQALARASLPTGRKLLSRFDYLSTVSGGGYIGAFLVSLFLPGRLKEGTRAVEAAEQALLVLQSDPPGRTGQRAEEKSKAGAVERLVTTPLKWLRENGRYLAPKNSGDYLFAAAVGTRNFLALHYVIATVLLTLFLLSQATQVSLIHMTTSSPSALLAAISPHIPAPKCESKLQVSAVREELAASPTYQSLVVTNKSQCVQTERRIWWSVWVFVALAMFSFFAVPIGMSYWIVHPPKGGAATDSASAVTAGFVGFLVVAVVLKLLTWWQFPSVLAAWSVTNISIAHVMLTSAVLAGLALVFHLICLWTLWLRRGPKTITTVSEERRELSNWLSIAMGASLLVLAVGTIETVAQSIYLYLRTHVGLFAFSATGGAALAWITHKLFALLDQKEERSLLGKMPVSLLAGVVGISAALLLAVAWAYAAVWVRLSSVSEPQIVSTMWILAAAATITAVVSGRFPGFINLSSWHAFYSSRLRRAYLGATNGARISTQAASVLDSHVGDEPNTETYRGPSGAPLHLINVCVNQTMGSSGQLVQRDRKGENLCVTPVGYSIAGADFEFEVAHDSSDLTAALTISEWVGVSGAAVSTGLGRASSLGAALLLGISNVRLGRWWPSSASTETGLTPRSFKWLARKVIETQTYLWYELTARFHGADRQWFYLSDGGHFENTAIYELLRPRRKVGFIVVCDNGADPKFEFNDLSNAIRLARIDHQLEIDVDADALKPEALSALLTTPEEMRALQVKVKLSPEQNDNRCAILLKVRKPNSADVIARILVIKPRLIAAVPEDVKQYALTHSDFPQQTTANQFFDEAQWESYRKLGMCIGEQLFGTDTAPSKFWETLSARVHPHAT